MAKLIFEHNDEEIELPDDSPIAEVCEEAGVPFACTEGVCGTCVIEIKEGKPFQTNSRRRRFPW